MSVNKINKKGRFGKYGGQYNVGNMKFPLGILPSTKDYRYEGYYYGVGLAYGYQWLLSNRWSLEARQCDFKQSNQSKR